MKSRRFDVAQFFADLDWVRRRTPGRSWRDVAAEAGVTGSTLTRIAQGKRPDVDGLCALVSWADLELERYILPVADETQETPK